MSYQEKMVWTIIPKESFKVLRNCSKCGCKSKYSNTGNFRVNANGNFLDVWLIYQCEKCKNTLNLEIFERINPSKVSRSQYQKFLANDEELAFSFGRNKEFFQKNKAKIELEEMEYDVQENSTISDMQNESDKNIVIKNPYSLKIRLDKVLAKQLEISRAQVKKLVENGIVFYNQEKDLKKVIIYEDLEFTIKNLNN